MNTTNFYNDIKSISKFKDISDSSNYKALPKDWFVLATDIKSSTKAVEEGKYKEVNIVGALTIISILNLKKELDIPFVFGGDGSFILIPALLYDKSKQALLGVQKMAYEAYNLNLRIGIIPVSDIYKNKKDIYITKYAISKDYSQAMIKGGGLDLCDELLKTSKKYLIKEQIKKDYELDISGLECRWEAIKSPKDETLSIIIKTEDISYYENILNELEKILGSSQKRHPLSKDKTLLSFDSKMLEKEASLKTQNSFLKKFHIFKLLCINLLGKLLMDLKIAKWQNYKNIILSSCDTEKFDDTLRMVVSTNYTQTKDLEKYLEEQYQNKKLNYGIHKADSALMTCLIFERHGKHIHFVDSANGGYAYAAKNLKKQL